MDIPDGFKRCSKCERVLAVSAFSRNKCNKDGLQAQCKECGQQYRQENRERIIEKDRQYQQKNRERKSEYHRQYRRENRDRITEQYRQYRQENRERIIEKNRQYRQENRERIIEKNRQYRASGAGRVKDANRAARKRSLPDTFTPAQLQYMLDCFGHTCAVCGRAAGENVIIAADHWIPLTSPACPGTIITNMVPLCHGVNGCNNSKHNRDATVWLIDRFGRDAAQEIEARITAYFEHVKELTQ